MTIEITPTVLPAAKAKGINKKTAPATMHALRKTKVTKAKGTKRTTKAKPTTTKVTGNTFTSVDLAQEHGINAKTLRARIRRNIDAWEPLFKDGEKHIFADNKTTRAKVNALLN